MRAGTEPSHLPVVLDHVFVFVEDGEAAERAAVRSGLVPTHRRRHVGQGTENVCFRFGRVFIELLWVVDREELASPPVARTGLAERSLWRTLGTCPFGVCLRGFPPFETWGYDVPFPPGMSVEMSTDSPSGTMPLLFAFSTSTAVETYRQPHGDRITAVELVYPGAVAGRTFPSTDVPVVERPGREPRLVVDLDGATRRQTLDIPEANLRLRL